MSSIRLQSAADSWASDGPRTFVIGREVDCDIVSTQAAVSRRHAEIRAAGDGWEVVDLGSTHGTWVNGQRVQRHTLTGTTSIRFGDTSNGFDLTVTVTGAAAPPPAAPAPPPFNAPPPAAATAVGRPGPAPGQAPPAGPPPGLDVTMVPHAGGPGPGGFGGGPGLLVRVDGPDLRFPPGLPVRIGREPGLEVVCDDPAVSRQHALVEPRRDGWWLVDRSTSGTFIDGERITQYKLEEPTEVSLGHPTAGYELELVPVVAAGVAAKGIAKKKRRRTLAVVAAAVAILLVVGGGVTAAVLLGGDDDGGSQQASGGGEGLTESELDRAKAATVFLLAYDENGEPSHSGSGSVISEDGLILTNAHVADPAAPGQDSDPVAFVDIGFTNPENDDDPVELRYRAETIVSDGVLDIAVVKIVADAEGNEVDSSDLDLPEPLPIGDSDSLRTNDEITALGYPGLATAGSDLATSGSLPALTVTTGRVATFTGSDILDAERAEIDADLRIGSGNSGGPSIDENGEIVGLNTRVFTERISDLVEGEGGQFTGGSARVVPVNLAADVVEIAKDGGDPEYVSPYLENLTQTQPDMTGGTAKVEAFGWSAEGDQGQCQNTSTVDNPQTLPAAAGDVIYPEFVFTGLPDGANFAIDFFAWAPGIDPVQIGTVDITWDAGLDAQCVFVPFEVPADAPGLIAAPRSGEDYAVENPVVFAG
jgi:putative serine protease PepD